MSSVTGNKMYLIVKKKKGKDVAYKFVKELCHLGLGKIVTVNNKGVFKRFHPTDPECRDADEVAAKW